MNGQILKELDELIDLWGHFYPTYSGRLADCIEVKLQIIHGIDSNRKTDYGFSEISQVLKKLSKMKATVGGHYYNLVSGKDEKSKIKICLTKPLELRSISSTKPGW